jgi:hypothetical protein
MSTIKSNVKPIKAFLIGLVISGSAIGTANSELFIQEKPPVSSIITQYAQLKNANASSAQLQQFIIELNQRVTSNPNDSLAWQVLAQIYYSNGYHAYAVYAASEAIDLGQSTATLKKILLNSSAIVSESQLQADYLTDVMDTEFLKQYQYALSKIYGEVYGFNYDESLPKPPAPVVKPRIAKANKISSPKRRPSKLTTKKVKSTATRKQTTLSKPKKVSKPIAVKRPINKPTAKNRGSSSTDPFSILR